MFSWNSGSDSFADMMGSYGRTEAGGRAWRGYKRVGNARCERKPGVRVPLQGQEKKERVRGVGRQDWVCRKVAGALQIVEETNMREEDESIRCARFWRAA